MSSFESWMRQKGLSESSAKKYSGAVTGPLTAWANLNSILNGPLTAVKNLSTFQPISSAIQKLPIFIERNSTGHQMYSSALVKFAEFLQQAKDPSRGNPTMHLGEQTPISEKERVSLANKMVEALPGSRRRSQHDLEEGGGFRIIADGNQCAAVYFSNNALVHLVEFALDAKHIAGGKEEYETLISWLGDQKIAFGGHDARNHKVGKQLDWFRIGFTAYSDAVLFVQRLADARRHRLPMSRWAICNPTSAKQTLSSVGSSHTESAEPTSAPTDAWARTALRMVRTAQQTTAFSNGQLVVQTVKNKNNEFCSEDEFVRYVESLIEQQGRCCAISGLQLHNDGALADDEMKASLDRIDSNKHYEAGNLQVVCRFINRWKGADPNSQFTQLIERVRGHWILTARRDETT